DRGAARGRGRGVRAAVGRPHRERWLTAGWQVKGGTVIMVQVKVPTPLRKFTGGAGGVEAQGGTVAALVDDLERRYPGLKERICDESGQVRRFVNIFVNGEDIRVLKHLDTALKPGGEPSIVPATAGGREVGCRPRAPPSPAPRPPRVGRPTPP